MLPPPVFLDNGVEVNTIPMTNTELLIVSILFPGGQWAQAKRLQSDLAVQQIKSGTTQLPAEAWADKLDHYGATVTSGTSIAYSFIQLNCLQRALPDVLPLFCDMLISPAYEQTLLNHAIEEGILSYQMSEQKVAYVSKRLFYQHLLGRENPAGQYVDAQAYHDITRKDLLDYHHQYLALRNAVVYITGKVDMATLKLLNQHLGNIVCAQSQCYHPHHAPITTSTQMMHETTLPVPSVQSGLRTGKVMPDHHSSDFPAIHLTSVLLGGYFGSRLMKNIRERLGFTYGISSALFQIPYNSIFFISTETPREHISQCIEEIKKDIIDLQNHPVSEDELRNARNFMLGQFCRMTEVSLSLPTLLINNRANGITLKKFLHEQQIIQSLTPKDIQHCAQLYFSPEKMLITAAHGK